MVARVMLSLAFLVALSSAARAEKAPLAVLGIEVAGSPDKESTAHGRLLTDIFRGKVSISARFSKAPNSHKDLLDEKVAGNCDSEAAECMSKIGARMKAQFLIFGKIERRPKDRLDGYQVSMKALDIEKKTFREWGEWIPFSDFADGKLDARVTRGFESLTKDESAGATGNGVTGTVGITGPTGPRPPPKKSTGLGWKITAVTATAITVGLAAGGIAYLSKKNSLSDGCRIRKDAPANPPLGSPDTYDPVMSTNDVNDCAEGPTLETRSRIAGWSAVAVGGFALFAYYQGFIAKKESSTQTTAGSRVRKKKSLAVTPIVSPDGAGATVRIDW